MAGLHAQPSTIQQEEKDVLNDTFDPNLWDGYLKARDDLQSWMDAEHDPNVREALLHLQLYVVDELIRLNRLRPKLVTVSVDGTVA